MYSVKNIKRRSGRTGLTVTGIALAMALMVVMFSVGNGVQDSARSILSETGVDIFCQANGTIANMFLGDVDNGRALASSMVDDHPNIRAAFPILIETLYAINDTLRQALISTDPTDIPDLVNLTKKNKIEAVTIEGFVPELSGDFGGFEYLKGDGFKAEDDPFYAGGTYSGGVGSPNFTHEISINKVMADKLKIGLGDEVYLNIKLPSNITQWGPWLLNTTIFKVSAIVQASWERLGESGAFMHLSELQYMVGKTNDTVHQILIDLKDPTKADNVKAWIETNYEELEAFTVEDFLGEIEEMTAVFKGFGEMILLVTGVIAVMFVGTVMIISIRERMGEIAALRAIGFSKSSVFITIVSETFMIIVIGFLIGFLIGLPLANLLDNYLLGLTAGGNGDLPANFHFVTFTPKLLLQMGIIALIFGLVSGLVPAVWAARLNIASTLKKD